MRAHGERRGHMASAQRRSETLNSRGMATHEMETKPTFATTISHEIYEAVQEKFNSAGRAG